MTGFNPRQSLEYLYRELRDAKIALGRAEGKPNVSMREIDDLHKKINTLDGLIAFVIEKS